MKSIRIRKIEQEIAFIGSCTRSLGISYYLLECIQLLFDSVHLTSVKLSVIFPLNALRFIDMRERERDKEIKRKRDREGERDKEGESLKKEKKEFYDYPKM